MTRGSSVLNGKKVGVIGFNARPIAASLKKQGALAYVSDYWGDLDLPEVSTDCIAVLSPTPGVRQRQPLELPLHESLIDNFRFLTNDVELDYLIVGSGFDDHPDLLAEFYTSGTLIGSAPNPIKSARNHSYVKSLEPYMQCNTPLHAEYHSFDELKEGVNGREFPYLIRPLHSGGGSGIRYIGNQDDLKRFLIAKQDEGKQHSFAIQKYYRGHDYSCSVLSTGSDAKAVSVQAQLVGSPSAGRNCDFAYCGNFYPSGLHPTLEKKIVKTSEYLSTTLGLKGSIGFDFVVDEKNEIYLMEINPRIQGTLEMLEIAGDISITEEHVRAANQDLLENIPKFQPVVKMIVYSRRTGTVPNLSLFSNTFDITPKDVLVNRGDPICTVVKSEGDLLNCYRKTCETVYEIQRQITSLK